MSADLTTISAVKAYLVGTPFASHTITSLSGGTGNYAYRIHLSIPYEDQQTLVLKHAQPHVKNLTTISFGLERQAFEVDAMVRVKEWLPSESVVTVPKIYRFDEECHVIIMEDCGEEILTLKDFLREGKGSSSLLLAQTIGRSLGEFLGSMHNWSRENPAGILAVFEGNQQAKSMSAWATYGRVVATLSQKDILPALSEPPMEVSASDLETITKVASDMKSAMISARDTFVMGDFWPGNIMVILDSENNLRHLYILDWELAKPGLAGVELGQFCAEMDLLQRFDPVAKDPASTILSHFLRTYSSTAKPGVDVARHALAHWGVHLVVWTPRVPWGDKHHTRKVVEAGVQLLVASSGDDVSLGKSVVASLISLQ